MMPMATRPEDTACLATLLHAERLARSLSAQGLLERLQLAGRFQPHRTDAFENLCRAARIDPRDGVPATAAAGISRLLHRARLRRGAITGPVLLICESRPFEPDLADPQDQVMLRLLAGLSALGATGWVLRTPRSHVRPLTWLLKGLPARPAAIIVVGRLTPACVAVLRDLVPVVRLGVRSLSTGQVPCVEYDAHLEAEAIASYATANSIEQVGFLADFAKPAGKRCIRAEDLAALNALTGAAQNRHIDVPANLTFWIDASESMASCGILTRIARHLRSRDLLVVAGARRATEAAAAMDSQDVPRIVCRHWSAAGTPAVPVIGPDLDQLAMVLLARLLRGDYLPAEAAVLVPPTWHRPPSDAIQTKKPVPGAHGGFGDGR
jgi:hypothetical protein